MALAINQVIVGEGVIYTFFKVYFQLKVGLPFSNDKGKYLHDYNSWYLHDHAVKPVLSIHSRHFPLLPFSRTRTDYLQISLSYVCLPRAFVSFTNWTLISLVTRPTDRSLVEATSNKHSWSSPHCSSASCFKLSLCHVILSANMGSKSGLEKVCTLSFGAYVNNDWDWLICPKSIPIKHYSWRV